MKMYTALVAVVASLLTFAAARQLQATTAKVTFYDNSNYGGGGQSFSASVPDTGCGPCTDLVRLRRLLPCINGSTSQECSCKRASILSC